MKFVRMFLPILALVCLAAVDPLFAQTSPLLPSQKAPLSDRVVAYNIAANYNATNHSLDAQETLTWTNYTDRPQDRLPFHLYLNAFQPKSTFTREAYEGGNRDMKVGGKWDEKKFGADTIESFEVVGMGDLTSQLRFI